MFWVNPTGLLNLWVGDWGIAQNIESFVFESFFYLFMG